MHSGPKVEAAARKQDDMQTSKTERPGRRLEPASPFGSQFPGFVQETGAPDESPSNFFTTFFVGQTVFKVGKDPALPDTLLSTPKFPINQVYIGFARHKCQRS